MTGPRRIDDAFLSDIARQYREHVAAGAKPGPAIAAKEGAPVRTVHRWIYEARKRQILPRGQQGKVSGAAARWPMAAQIGAHLRRLRLANDMSQEEAGEAMGELLGLPAWTRQAVSAAEKGRRGWAADEVAALADVFGVTPGSLFETPPVCPNCQGAPLLGFACTECDARSSK